MTEAPEVHSGGKDAECRYASVRHVAGSLLVGRVDVDGRVHGVLVGANQQSCGDSIGNEPLRVVGTDVKWAGPDGFLIGEQAARCSGEGDFFGLGCGCEWIWGRRTGGCGWGASGSASGWEVEAWMGVWAKLGGPDSHKRTLATHRGRRVLLKFTGVRKDLLRARTGIRLLLVKGYHRRSPEWVTDRDTGLDGSASYALPLAFLRMRFG